LEQRRALALLQQRAGGRGDALSGGRRSSLQGPRQQRHERRERRYRERDGGAHGWIGSNRIGSGAKRAVHVPCKRKTVKKFAKSRKEGEISHLMSKQVRHTNLRLNIEISLCELGFDFMVLF